MCPTDLDAEADGTPDRCDVGHEIAWPEIWTREERHQPRLCPVPRHGRWYCLGGAAETLLVAEKVECPPWVPGESGFEDWHDSTLESDAYRGRIAARSLTSPLERAAYDVPRRTDRPVSRFAQ